MAPQSPSRRPEDELIDTIVDHVRKGDAKREEALEHYRQAGEGLIELKALCRTTGRGFKELVKVTSTLPSYMQATRLMKLANEWPVDWDRWQEICGNKKPPKPATVKTPAPDPDDLSHAAKLIAMRDRGGTENERRVAADKLSRFASTFDMTADVLETKAQAAAVDDTAHTQGNTTNDRPEPDLRDFDRSYQLWLQRVRKHTASCDRETLIDLLARLHASLECAGLDPVGGRPSWERG